MDCARARTMLGRMLLVGWLGLACTWPVGTSEALGQTISLPSIYTFSVDTTVVVPDSGAGFVGGTKRASSASNRLGLFPPQRAAGVERQAAGVAVTARIHDPEAADAALLKEARDRRAATKSLSEYRLGEGDSPILLPGHRKIGTVPAGSRIGSKVAPAAKGSARSNHALALSADDPGLQSVSELRRRQAASATNNDRETLELVERARRSASAGKTAIAASYYRSAARQASPALKRQIDSEWRALAAPKTTDPAVKPAAVPAKRGVAF